MLMSRERIEGVIAACATLAAQFAETVDAEDRDGHFPREKAELARVAGLSALTVPEEFGGMGGGVWDMCRALQALAWGDPSVALGIAMHLQAMGAAAEQRGWRPDAFAALCAASVNPGIFVNSVHSEPEMGSPSRGGFPATRAIATSGGYVITGNKRWATFAPALDFFLISATLETANGPIVGVFAVSASATGLTSDLMNVGSFIFRFQVTPGALISGLIAGALIGALGGLLPAWRASRIGVIDSLRAV